MNFNKLWLPWKPVDVQLGTISENVRIGDYYHCANFHACIKKCTISNLPEISSYAPGLTCFHDTTNLYKILPLLPLIIAESR